MEASARLKFNCFLCPSSSSNRGKESGFSLSSSFLPLCVDDRIRTGFSPHRQSTARLSESFALNAICSRRKCVGVPGNCCNPKEEFGSMYYNPQLYTQNKLSRYVVGRCGLAEVGTADAAYPFSELQLDSRVRAVCFYTVTSVSAIFLFLLMLVAHPFVLVTDRYQRKAHHLIAKIWASLTVAPFYKVKLEGMENLPRPDNPAVYVSNHQSFLDIYTLLTLGGTFKFISKTAIFLYPIIGWAMFMMGTIPLKRMDSRSQLETYKRCIDLVKKGASVFFFPEGTRSRDGKLGVFKKGAFSIAAKTGVPVVPITLIGTGKIMPARMENVVNKGSVRVVIHKPIEGSDPEKLCNEARNIIAEALVNAQ